MVKQQPLNLEQLTVEQLQQQINSFGFAHLSTSVDCDLEGAYSKFVDFISLRKDVVLPFWEVQVHGTRGSEIGYVAKKSEQGKDPKRLFHYHHKVRQTYMLDERLNPKLNPLGMTDEEMHVAQEFFTAADEVYGHFVAWHTKMLNVFDAEFPGLIHKYVESRHMSPDAYLRFLAYDDVREGETSAAFHLDNGGAMTIAGYETGPGLRILDPTSGPIPSNKERDFPQNREKDCVAIPAKRDTLVTFPGRYIEDMTEPGFLIPGWHGVVREPHEPYLPREQDHMYGRGVGRGAIVCFINERGFVQRI